MKTDDYFRRTEDLLMIDPLVAYEEVEQFPELFDAKEAVFIISTEVDIIERQMHQPGVYPIPQSPVPTTSGFVPHRPTPTFKPISPAMPSPAAGSSQQGSFNFLWDQVNSTQNGSPSSGSSIPCAQRSLANKQNLHPHKLTHRMLHHHNLLHQHPNHFSRLLLHTSNSSHCYSHHHQAKMLHTSSKVSHNLYNLGLALKANLLGNQGNYHHLDKVLISLCSLSFQLQRHNKIQCPTPRSLEFQSQQMDRE